MSDENCHCHCGRHVQIIKVIIEAQKRLENKVESSFV